MSFFWASLRKLSQRPQRHGGGFFFVFWDELLLFEGMGALRGRTAATIANNGKYENNVRPRRGGYARYDEPKVQVRARGETSPFLKSSVAASVFGKLGRFTLDECFVILLGSPLKGA
jgi:hypothetical protein